MNVHSPLPRASEGARPARGRCTGTSTTTPTTAADGWWSTPLTAASRIRLRRHCSVSVDVVDAAREVLLLRRPRVLPVVRAAVPRPGVPRLGVAADSERAAALTRGSIAASTTAVSLADCLVR